MKNRLPENVITVREMMSKCETSGGILRCLPQLLNAIQKDGGYATALLEFEKELKDRLIKDQKNLEQAIQWMEDCFGKLKQSPFASHPIAKPFIDTAEQLLIHRRFNRRSGFVLNELGGKCLGNRQGGYNPLDRNWGFLNACFDALRFATDVVAGFRNDPLFENWASIGLKHQSLEKLCPILPEEAVGDIALNIDKKNELASIFEHGIDCWVVEKPKEITEGLYYRTIYLRRGYLERLILPNTIKEFFRFHANDSKNNWIEVCESDSVTTYKLIKLLAEYESFETIPLLPKDEIESWEDAEKFVRQADVRMFLSRFRSENPLLHPMSLLQLQNLIDRFLIFVSLHKSQSKDKRGSRQQKECARQAIRKATEKKWDDLSKQGITPRKHDDFTPRINEIIQQDKNLSNVGLTDSLIKEEVSKFAKEKKFVAKRGPDKEKRLTYS